MIKESSIGYVISVAIIIVMHIIRIIIFRRLLIMILIRIVIWKGWFIRILRMRLFRRNSKKEIKKMKKDLWMNSLFNVY